MAVKPKQKLKFHAIWWGKPYYKGAEDRVLYCLDRERTPDGGTKVVCYQCSKDGEPSWEITMPARERFDTYVEPT